MGSKKLPVSQDFHWRKKCTTVIFDDQNPKADQFQVVFFAEHSGLMDDLYNQSRWVDFYDLTRLNWV